MRANQPALSVNTNTGTQALHRAVELLKLIASFNRTGMRLVDLYRVAGMERPTAHRILQGLIAEQMVYQDQHSKRYHLGPLLYEMGLAAAPKVALRDLFWPYLKIIAEQTQDTVFMTVRSGFDGVCVARAEGSYPIKVFTVDVGRHRPLNTGAGGTALLAAMPDLEAERISRVNVERMASQHPGLSIETVRANITGTRRKGYALQKVLAAPGAMAVGIAVLNPDGSPAAGISVSTLASRLGRNRLGMVVQCLNDAARQIHADLATHLSAHGE